jgi:hypothetical protein
MRDKEEIKRLRLEIESLKKDRDEWKDSSSYWSGTYDDEHSQFLDLYNQLGHIHDTIRKLLPFINLCDHLAHAHDTLKELLPETHIPYKQNKTK